MSTQNLVYVEGPFLMNVYKIKFTMRSKNELFTSFFKQILYLFIF